MFTTAIRRPLLTAAILLTAAYSLHAAPAPAAAGADQCPGAKDLPASQGDVDRATDAVMCLVNVERTTRGLKALKRDSDLAQAARGHSRDMAGNKYFEHTSPNGDTVGDRIRQAGYGKPGDGWRVGENLGWGTGERATPNSLVDMWLNSPPHRKNMLTAAYRDLGVGVAPGAPTSTRSSLAGATYTLNLGVIR